MNKRPRVIDPAGGVYHCGSRGSNRQLIYLDALDHDIWIRLFVKVARRYGWEILAWVEMPNHFHVLVRIPDASLAAGMQQLNYMYSRQTNARHGRTQHLFANRFWSELVETQDQLFRTFGYIDANPYKANARVHPRDWKYGSHAAIAGYAAPPSFLDVDAILRLFHPDRSTAVVLYRELVAGAMARVDVARSQATVTRL